MFFKTTLFAFLLVFFSTLKAFGQWLPVDSGTPRVTLRPRPTPLGQWSPVDSGTTSNLNGAFLLDSGTGFIVGDTGTILKTTDAGATWVPLTSGTTTTLHNVYCFDPGDAVAVGDQGLILRTTDGGAVWETVASGVTDNLLAVSFNGAGGLCGGDSQTILFSTDSAASWCIAQSGLFGGGFPGAHMLNSTTGFPGRTELNPSTFACLHHVLGLLCRMVYYCLLFR
jgi:hypothetical protein